MANKDTVVKARFGPKQQKMISQQYERGASVQALANRWHCSKERIKLVLEVTGTPLRGRGTLSSATRASGAGQTIGPADRQLDYCAGCKQTPCWTPMTCGPRLRALKQQAYRIAEMDRLDNEEARRESIKQNRMGHSDDTNERDPGAGPALQDGGDGGQPGLHQG